MSWYMLMIFQLQVQILQLAKQLFLNSMLCFLSRTWDPFTILGIEVWRSSKGIFISQTKYILDLLKKAHMDVAKPCVTPLSTSKLDHSSPLLDNPEEYRSLVRGLQYLTWTRPDLSFAVNLVCQFMQSLRQSHFQAVKRIFRYLKSSNSLGLGFPNVLKHLVFTISQMQTRQVVLLIEDPQVVFVFFQVIQS